MADYMIGEEKDLIALPDELSYADGAQVACGCGTAYEAIEKSEVNGNHSVLITGPRSSWAPGRGVMAQSRRAPDHWHRCGPGALAASGVPQTV
jgi:D-arabinose 1-dehydrogenase-like Zn-dependent alcohol dehydrogenase